MRLDEVDELEIDAGLQHILCDKCLTNSVEIFTLLFKTILGFSKIAYNLGIKVPQYLYGAKNMNMISTGAFQPEMDASNKQQTLAEKFVAIWEKKNAKAARASGLSLMALSLAACGSSDDSTSSSTTTTTDTTTTTSTNDAAQQKGLTSNTDILTTGSGDDSID